MGLFDAIGGALGISGDSAMLGGLGLFNGIMGMNSQADTNAQSMQMFYGNQDFQREMRDTQYQSAVKDLSAAGLNPMLAGKVGGNMASGGSSIPSLQAPYAAGTQAALNTASVGKIRADTEASNSQTEVNHALALKTMADARLTTATARNQEWLAEQNDYLKATGDYLPTLAREMYARSGKALLEQTNYERDYRAADALDRYAVSQGFKNFPDAVNNVDFRRNLFDLKMRSLDVPRGEALSDFYKSSFGHDVAPYLNSASSMESIGSGVIGTGIKLFRKGK